MTSTRDELERFQQFAADRLATAASEPSFDELFLEWQDRRERETVNQAIRRGLADADAGRHEPIEQAMAAIREEFGFTKK